MVLISECCKGKHNLTDIMEAVEWLIVGYDGGWESFKTNWHYFDSQIWQAPLRIMFYSLSTEN